MYCSKRATTAISCKPSSNSIQQVARILEEDNPCHCGMRSSTKTFSGNELITIWSGEIFGLVMV